MTRKSNKRGERPGDVSATPTAQEVATTPATMVTQEERERRDRLAARVAKLSRKRKSQSVEPSPAIDAPMVELPLVPTEGPGAMLASVRWDERVSDDDTAIVLAFAAVEMLERLEHYVANGSLFRDLPPAERLLERLQAALYELADDGGDLQGPARTTLEDLKAALEVYSEKPDKLIAPADPDQLLRNLLEKGPAALRSAAWALANERRAEREENRAAPLVWTPFADADFDFLVNESGAVAGLQELAAQGCNVSKAEVGCWRSGFAVVAVRAPGPVTG